MKSTTEHFEIIYPSTLSGIENQAAAIAESTYSVLSSNIGVSFDRPLRIYLSDRDEITNGYAVPLRNTFIWADINEYMDVFTDQDKWLRKVISHELAHQFHFEAIRSNIGLLDYLFNDPMPSFWAEGFAQYETETWNAQRGDRWLRKAVFDDAMSYSGGNSIYSGRLLYATGHSQLRFFTEQYGDSTLSKMMSHRKSIGPIKYHDFEEAWEKTTGSSYSSFYDRWRKHMNVYYNALATTYERTDSLTQEDPVSLPGQYIFDVAFAPDTSSYLVLSRPSMRRPITQLHEVQNDSTLEMRLLAEGRINDDLSWSNDGELITYSRLLTYKNGRFIPQLYLLNPSIDEEYRLVRSDSLRTISPVLRKPADQPYYQLAFIGIRDGVANIYRAELTGQFKLADIRRITDFTKDTELTHLQWSPDGAHLASDIFTADRKRGLFILNLETGNSRVLDRPNIDDRDPIWSPDGKSLAFTSLEDKVPNIWTYDTQHWDQDPARKTAVFTGAELLDWIPADSLHPQGRFIVSSSESKHRDYIYRVNANRSKALVDQSETSIPTAYRSWQTHTPPTTISQDIPPNADLINETKPYRSFSEWQHVFTFGLPYADENDKLGLFFTTTFQEPLNKHVFSLTGGVSTSEPKNQSWGLITYVNNTLYPSLVFSAYQLPGSIRFYGNDLLVERQRGGDITMLWPHNIVDSYAGARSAFRLRHVAIKPLDVTLTGSSSTDIAAPQNGNITDLAYSFTYRKMRPYAYNLVHPLDGFGIRASLTGAVDALGSDAEFIRPALAAYTILPGLGKQRLFLYGKLQAQWGSSLNQDYIGFSKYDNLQLPLPIDQYEVFGRNERVRGYRDFVAGDRVAFGSLEYRIPLLPSLQTEILGFLSFGATTVAAFTDAGLVWDPTYQTADRVEQWGTGLELKNEVHLGPITFTHNVGWARPVSDFSDASDDWYYRIRTAIPF
jgi:Tol biopolymer transport system component